MCAPFPPFCFACRFAVSGGGATTQTRTHNSQNQTTAISGATSPQYNAAGEMTTEETGLQSTYDAWGRVTRIKGDITDFIRYEFEENPVDK